MDAVRHRIAAALLVLAFAPSGAAAAEPGWDPTIEVSEARAEVVPAAPGELLAFWHRDDLIGPGPLQVAPVFPGGHLGPARTVAPDAALGAEPASDERGRVLLVWEADGLRAVVREAGAGFGQPFAIESPEGSIGAIDVSMNESGHALIAFSAASPGGLNRVFAVFRAPSGALTPPLPVSEAWPSGAVPLLDASLAENGESTIAWEVVGGCTTSCAPPTQIHVTTGTAAAGFQPPRLVSDATQRARNPLVGTAADGSAVVAWAEAPAHVESPAEWRVRAAFRAPGGTFATASELGRSRDWNTHHVGVSGDGRALLAWDGTDSRPHLADARAATGAVEDERTFEYGYGVNLAVGRSGHVLLTWLRVNDTYYGLHGVWTEPGGQAGPVRAIACPPGAITAIDAMMGRTGDAALESFDSGLTPYPPDDRLHVQRTNHELAPPTEGCASSPLGSSVGPLPGSTRPAQNAEPTATASAPPPEAPRASLRVARRARLDARGRVRLVFTSTAAGRITISGWLRRGTRRARLRLTKIDVGAGRSAVAVPPARRQRKRFRSARVRVLLEPAGGRRTAAVRTVSLTSRR